MARIPLSSIGTTPYERVMGHVPHILEPWVELEHAFLTRSILPAELLEQVRRTLALGHRCQYCQAKGGPPDSKHDAMRTSLAVGFAQIFASDHHGVDERMLNTMREHFTDPELVELVAFMGFMWGGTFGNVLGIQPALQYENREGPQMRYALEPPNLAVERTRRKWLFLLNFGGGVPLVYY